MIYSVSMTKGLMKSVTDFLSAGRTAGRYVISVSSGVAGLGAISIVMFLEMGYVAGFSLSWWGLSQGIIILAITMSGWVVYRFRSTRCLTLAQFFEKRYITITTTFVSRYKGRKSHIHSKEKNTQCSRNYSPHKKTMLKFLSAVIHFIQNQKMDRKSFLVFGRNISIFRMLL